MIAKQSFGIDVFTLDTGRLFQQTYELLDKTTKRYSMPIKVYYPLIFLRGGWLFYTSMIMYDIVNFIGLVIGFPLLFKFILNT